MRWHSIAGVNVRKIAGLSQDIAAHLEGLAGTVDKVSIRKLKADMRDKLKDVSNRTWTFALERYLEDSPPWRLQERSLERVSGVFSQVTI